MVQTIETPLNDDLFTISNIFPRNILNSRGDTKPFNPDKMIESLNTETGLDWNDCIAVVKDALKRIVVLGMQTIQTSMVREIMCLELTAKGFHRERNIYAKMINSNVIRFKLEEKFLDKFRGQQPNWGPLGYVTYKRTYARFVHDESNPSKVRTEEFWETIRRVVEGCYFIQKQHCIKFGLPWDEQKSQRSAQTMFQKMWEFRFLPPGRGLWMMGTEFIEKHGSMALNNCGFSSTEDIAIKKSKAFEFVMDALMLGVGVGFDTKGAGKLIIKKPNEETFVFEIPDSREGWVEALRHLLTAYFDGDAMPVYDFSKIRPKGALIRGFGGVASGPDPLREMLNSQKILLETRIGTTLTSVDIVDMMNFIGKCVVAGNVRRSAEIALGLPDDEAYITCKQDQEALYDRRWASNNSIIGKPGMDYNKIVDSIAKNGEPGIIYLDNARAYSRMGYPPDHKDKLAMGVNPCITGDTLIAVADGRSAISIQQLAEEDKDVPVYCKDSSGVTHIRMMRNPRITGKSMPIFEVKFDDGSVVRCTGNHKFLATNNSMVQADQLRPGDSIMIMAKWETTWDEIMSQKTSLKKKSYWMINDGRKNHFEHSFIFKEANHQKILPSQVIHHKDHNGLNNAVGNLELMSKEEHESLHDISSEKNPMRKWFPIATEEEQSNYRKHMSEATAGEKNARYSGLDNETLFKHMLDYIVENKIPLTVPAWKKYAAEHQLIYNFNTFRGKLVNLIRLANIQSGYEHFENPALMREYKKFIALLATSDLELCFENGIRIIKKCEKCQSAFKVKYGNREQAFCSHACANKKNALFAGKATKSIGKKRNQRIRDQICNLFRKYVVETKKVPAKKEFIEYLQGYGINDLRTAGLSSSYQAFLNHISEKHAVNRISLAKIANDPQYAATTAQNLVDNGLAYNHKVVSITNTGMSTVYNGTVDEFHNYGIVLNEKQTQTGRRKLDIIFTANCGEQTLESFELCCLVETFPSKHESYEEFEETLKFAYLYAKTVTLINTHWNETNAVMGKNRRIGTSQSGIIDAFAKFGRKTVLEWCEKGYHYLKKLDEQYSDFFCVPNSIKITTVKPSGTVSLLPGVSPGIHYPHSEYYIRRIRISKESTLVDILKEAGYPVEDDLYSQNSVVAEFPVQEENFLRAKDDVSIWEQIANAIDYQHYWSDNQVSITVTFKPAEVKDIPYVLQFAEDKLKGLSLLPLENSGYKQMPYEAISKEEFLKRKAQLKPIKTWSSEEKSSGTIYCDGDSCKAM